jgi:hypothetical protein
MLLAALACAQTPVSWIYAPVEDAETASIQAFFKVGSAYEADEHAGVTHLVEHLLFRRGDPGSLDREVERLGGRLEATTHRDLLRVWCTVPKENVVHAARVLRQAVAPLSADEAAIEAEKRLLLQELKLQSLNPEQAALDSLWGRLASGTTYALPTGGRAEAVQRLEPQFVLDWGRRMLSRERFTLVLCGSVSAYDVSRIRELFEDLPPSDTRPAEPPTWQVADRYIHESVSDIFGVAFRAPSPGQTRAYAAWMVAWEVLGGVDGLARRAGFICRARLDPTGAGTLGALVFSHAAHPKVEQFLESDDVRSPSEAVIAGARSTVVARWQAMLAKPEERAFWEGALRLWGAPPPSEILEILRRSTPDEVRAVLRSLGGRQ